MDAGSFTLVSQTSTGVCPRTVTRTYCIADSCGNVSSCAQVFTVDDNTPPSITCPAGTTVECFGDLPLAYTTLAQFTAAGGTASDNCGRMREALHWSARRQQGYVRER